MSVNASLAANRTMHINHMPLCFSRYPIGGNKIKNNSSEETSSTVPISAADDKHRDIRLGSERTEALSNAKERAMVGDRSDVPALPGVERLSLDDLAAAATAVAEEAADRAGGKNEADPKAG